MLAKEPQRFQRLVDTLFLEDIIYILCKHSLYKELFKEALDYNYPQGLDEVREFLNRIVPIRNALSHSNPISVRQAEQAICYSNDFIDGLKKYYTQKGLEKMWNVPSIIKVTDSLGNVFYPSDAIARTIFIKDKNGVFRVGDTYKISVEIDPSFEPSSYNVEWNEENSLVLLTCSEEFISNVNTDKEFAPKMIEGF